MSAANQPSHDLLSLPDDILTSIGRWTASFDSQDFLRFQRTCTRMRKVLGNNSMLDQILIDLGMPSEVKTLQQLAFYDAINRVDLKEENRIGFTFASTEIDFSDEYTNTSVVGSRTRIDAVRRVLQRFHNSAVIVEAHCGTLAPRGIAVAFSRVRGITVCAELLQQRPQDFCTEGEERVFLNAWGYSVSSVATRSKHQYSDLAREGKGWAELYLRLGELELPSRPDYWLVGQDPTTQS